MSWHRSKKRYPYSSRHFHEILGPAGEELLGEHRGLKLIGGILHENEVLSISPDRPRAFEEVILDDVEH